MDAIGEAAAGHLSFTRTSDYSTMISLSLVPHAKIVAFAAGRDSTRSLYATTFL